MVGIAGFSISFIVVGLYSDNLGKPAPGGRKLFFLPEHVRHIVLFYIV
jgi:hypothetical protein